MTDIDFSNIDVDSDISILIGADNSMLHLYTDIHVGNENEPVALKTKLGWVIFRGCQNNNKYPNVNVFWKYGFKVLANRVIWCLRKTKLKYFTTNGTTCFKYL